MSKKDQVFNRPIKNIKGFEFNEEVAACFDDMVSRSVPFYDEIHRIILDLIDRTQTTRGPIYDLGCSTATTFTLIDKHLKSKNKKIPAMIGIDNSQAMLDKAQAKIQVNEMQTVELRCQNIEEVELDNPSMVIMNYTLQFIPVERRVTILKRIYDSLTDEGIFILAEKLKSPTRSVDNLLTDLYYDFKRRNGYSELEISQKREALENVLVPLTPKRQMNMLREAGFKRVEMIFRWYNFACYLGIKKWIGFLNTQSSSILKLFERLWKRRNPCSTTKSINLF